MEKTCNKGKVSAGIVFLIVIILFGAFSVHFVNLRYSKVLEKGKHAEAKYMIKEMYDACKAVFNDDGPLDKCAFDVLSKHNITPNEYNAQSYFRYSVEKQGDSEILFTATRCTSGGRGEQGKSPWTLSLSADYSTDKTIWEDTLSESTPVPYTGPR